MNIDEIRLVEKEMRKIIPIFLNEFIDYVSYKKREYLKDDLNLRRVISFESGFGAWCRGNNIFIAIQNGEAFKAFSKRPDYGQNKGRKLLSDKDDFVDNMIDYVEYMQYLIDNGLKEIDYCLDVLPHEVMHLIGCGNGVIGEGVTELRTRQTCLKYGIRCAPIMHSKETLLVKKLEKHLGKMILDEAAFYNDCKYLLDECERVFGKEFKELYEEICIDYRAYSMDRTRNPLEHYENYRKLDYSKLYELIDSKEKIEI